MPTQKISTKAMSLLVIIKARRKGRAGNTYTKAIEDAVEMLNEHELKQSRS